MEQIPLSEKVPTVLLFFKKGTKSAPTHELTDMYR